MRLTSRPVTDMPITDAMVEAAAKVLDDFDRYDRGGFKTWQEVARAALTAALSQDEWQDVGSAPKDGTRFLVIEHDGYSGDFVVPASWQDEYNGFTDDYNRVLIPTKWCRIPPIPNQEEG